MLCVIDSYINCPIYLRIDISQRQGQLTYRHTFKFNERYYDCGLLFETMADISLLNGNPFAWYVNLT